MYTANQTILSLCASGRTTGLVINSGDGVLRTVPIYEDYALLMPSFVWIWLAMILQTTAKSEIGRDVKDKLCFVAFVYDKELKSTAESFDKNQTYMLSDGNVGTVGAERFR